MVPRSGCAADKPGEGEDWLRRDSARGCIGMDAGGTSARLYAPICEEGKVVFEAVLSMFRLSAVPLSSSTYVINLHLLDFFLKQTS